MARSCSSRSQGSEIQWQVCVAGCPAQRQGPLGPNERRQAIVHKGGGGPSRRNALVSPCAHSISIRLPTPHSHSRPCANLTTRQAYSFAFPRFPRGMYCAATCPSHGCVQNGSGIFPVSINSTIGQCPVSCFSAIFFLTAPGMLPPISMHETFSMVTPPSYGVNRL